MRPDDSPLAAPEFLQLHHPDSAAARDEVEAGLLGVPAQVSPKFFYDSLGSKLFEAITELPEYYPTRTEASILARHGADIARRIGEVGTLVDLGAGNCAKAARLFDLLRPRRYVAVDISVEFLRDALLGLAAKHPRLEMRGYGVDFSSRLDLPEDATTGRPVYFYPGSSLGNFAPPDALALLRQVRGHAAGGGLLIGIDLVKPRAVLEAAYDDALGVTAAFNLNLLRNLDRLLGSDCDPRGWRHVALMERSPVAHRDAPGSARGARRALAGRRAALRRRRAAAYRELLQVHARRPAAAAAGSRFRRHDAVARRRTPLRRLLGRGRIRLNRSRPLRATDDEALGGKTITNEGRTGWTH